MSFVPPKFADLGKSASDLFKKKFDDKKDFKYKVETKNKTASGLVFTTGGEFDSKINLTGNVKVNYKNANFGEVEGSLSTAGPSKVEVKMKKLTKGLVVVVTGDTATSFKKNDNFDRATAKLAAEYTQDFFAGAASIETAFTRTNILAGSGVIGFDGLSVGGEIKFNTNKTSDVEDYNVGAEYAGADFTATLKTEKKGNVLTASYLHKVSGDLTVGGQFSTKLDGTKLESGSERTAGVAAEYKVDAQTGVKVRANTDRVAALAVEHRLPKSSLAVGLASSWGIASDFSVPKPKDFGLSFTFGDFDA